MDYVKSRELCDKALEQAPEYFDVLIFKARIYSWEKKYVEARQILEKVLEDSPSEKDAYLALLDVELWTNNFNEVIKLSDQALKYFTKNPEILIRKAKALHKLEKNKDAQKLVEQILAVEPENKEAKQLLNDIEDALKMYKLTLSYDYTTLDYFDKDWHETFLSLSRKTKYGKVIFRANYANRFGVQDQQYELDAYPILWKGAYGYFNVGTSPYNSLFPKYRQGFDLNQKLPKSFESAFGNRYLWFSNSSDVIIYTSGLGKYLGNYWLNFRAYLIPGRNELNQSSNIITSTSWSKTFMINFRKYFSDKFNYIGVRVTSGVSPEVRNLSSVQSQDFEVVDMLNAARVGFEWNKSFKNTYFFALSGFYSFEERKYFNLRMYNIGLSLAKTF